ncbi:Transient receptor potential protein [Atta colombica]|uniref:Transient receptor potential protein n=1 Tax=Atta colombica TaxID=520822 RepID=A0A195AYU6_9HYME|nr:Transient receptor potential protein [Atta colombica]
MNPIYAGELLFFAIFGQTTHEELKTELTQAKWTTALFKITFGIYMLVSVVVLINLLIAMMSDTYQRIQAQSDIEWKYGLSKLVRNMHRTFKLLVARMSKLFTALLVSFSLYMLVSVIVLINLLIAMMTDTYHNIQSQSDIEWKYGLSKLIRKMQKTRTAPFPLNLVTTWAEYIKNACVKERIARQKISRSRGYMEPDAQRIFPKFSTNSRMLPLPRAAKERINFSLLQSNSTTSQTSLNNIPKIQNIVDWDIVRRKYRMRFGDEIEKPVDKFAHNGGAEIIIAAFTKLKIHPIGAFHGDKAIRMHDRLGEKLMRSTMAAGL